MKKMVILKARDISAQIQKMARAIIEHNKSMEHVVLVGIRTGGAFLAFRLQKAIGRLKVAPPLTGVVDITLYRDDWTRIGPTPIVGKTELPFSIHEKTVILVDDVLFTGRTVRAAMDALIDYGRPRKIELAVLVDRGVENRELPIMANYVGRVCDTSPDETVNVCLKEAGLRDHVVIEQMKAASVMHRKKRQENKRPLEILSAADEALVASLVECAKTSAPEDLAARIPDVRVALALVERLRLDQPGVVPILAAIDERIPDKKVHKAVSRALFTLTDKRDFRGEGPRGEGFLSLLRPVQRESSSAYVGTMDMSGTRVVFLLPLQESCGS